MLRFYRHRIKATYIAVRKSRSAVTLHVKQETQGYQKRAKRAELSASSTPTVKAIIRFDCICIWRRPVGTHGASSVATDIMDVPPYQHSLLNVEVNIHSPGRTPMGRRTHVPEFARMHDDASASQLVL